MLDGRGHFLDCIGLFLKIGSIKNIGNYSNSKRKYVDIFPHEKIVSFCLGLNIYSSATFNAVLMMQKLKAIKLLRYTSLKSVIETAAALILALLYLYVKLICFIAN